MKSTEDLIRAEEGFVEHAYQDHLGFWTIGYGRMIDQRRGGRITPIEAEYLLKNDIARISGDLRLNFKWFDMLNEVRKAVLVSMVYQLGPRGFANFKKTIQYLSEGRFAEAADEMLNSQWARQTPKRAQRASQMMRTGEWL